MEDPVKASSRGRRDAPPLLHSCHEATQMPICNHWFLSGSESIHAALHLPVEPGARTMSFPMQIRVLASISIFVAGAAHADPTRDALAEIARCAGIGDSSERLKCFDAAALRTKDAPAAQKATEARGRIARGRSIFVLDNGQVWRQLDGDDADVQDPRPGEPMKVAIETGLLGNYNLTIEGRNALIRVRRLK